MRAKIVNVTKDTIPQYSAAVEADVPTLVVKTTVEFYRDDETLYLTQEYAQRSEEIDADNPGAYFDRQAQILQADLDGQAANIQNEVNSQLADSIIEKLQPEVAIDQPQTE